MNDLVFHEQTEVTYREANVFMLNNIGSFYQLSSLKKPKFMKYAKCNYISENIGKNSRNVLLVKISQEVAGLPSFLGDDARLSQKIFLGCVLFEIWDTKLGVFLSLVLLVHIQISFASLYSQQPLNPIYFSQAQLVLSYLSHFSQFFLYVWT